MHSTPELHGFVQTLDPFAFKLGADFGIRWYGLSYLAGFLAGYLLIRHWSKKGIALIPEHLVGDFIFNVAIGTIIGGRLGYCLLYDQSLLTKFTSEIPFWGVLAVHQGGMASHGGILGIFVAAYLFGRKHKINFLHLADLTALAGPIGVFFGRLANFVNGELVGRACSAELPWAVRFPQDILSWPSYEPGRLAGLADLVSKLGIDPALWAGWVNDISYSRSSWEKVNAALQKIVETIQAGDSALTNSLAPFLTPRHPSQLYEAGLEGLLLFLILFMIWRAPRKPGVITGLFFVFYAVVRILGEQFRLPDLQIGYQIFGLTRGQILSLVMLALGALVAYFWSTRTQPKIGGWARKKQN